jgi:type I restriction enzyme M protein
MSNESKTTNITRKHFEQFENQVLLEEYQSDNPKIKKLLSTASKKGDGAGYPDL